MTAKVLEAMKKTESSELANQVQGALTKAPKEEGFRILLNVEALPPAVETQVRKWYHELNQALGQFGKAGLRIGQILKEAREVLKPLGVWIAFLNRVPGMSAKTGDRFIKRYEMAEKRLPQSVLAISLATGIQLAGEDEKQPFGRYSRIVKKVGPPPKDSGEEDKDMERAEGWLVKVLTLYSKGRARQRAIAKGKDPADKAAEVLVRKAKAYIKDPEGQVDFIQRVVLKALKTLGFKDVLVQRKGTRKPVGSVA